MKIIKNKYLYHESIKENLNKVSGSIQIDVKLTKDTDDYKKSTVYGIVKDENLKVIKNALVNILSEDKISLMHTYTNEKGEYSFFNAMASGNYNIIAIYKDKKLNKEESFRIHKDKDTRIDLVLNEDKELNLGIIEGEIISFITKIKILNAYIKLFKKNKNNHVELFGVTSTNKLGEYSFLKVPKGNYILSVHAKGYISIEAYTSITTEGQIVSMPLTMQYGHKNFYKS